jgi:hypothetical protein
MGDRTSGGGYKFGSPIEKATADALKNAAEMFGVGAYLDNQQFVIKYLHSKGDGRGVKFAQENDWKAAGAMGRPKTAPAPAPPPEVRSSKKINEAQARTFCDVTYKMGKREPTASYFATNRRCDRARSSYLPKNFGMRNTGLAASLPTSTQT